MVYSYIGDRYEIIVTDYHPNNKNLIPCSTQIRFLNIDYCPLIEYFRFQKHPAGRCLFY